MMLLPYSFFNIQWFDSSTKITVGEAYLEDLTRNGVPDEIAKKAARLEAGQSILLDRIPLDCRPSTSDPIAWESLPVRLTHETSELPYRIHSGREYDLIRKKTKPLAVFSHVPASSSIAVFLDKYFEPKVKMGEWTAGTIIEADDTNTTIPPTRLYALPGEAWRIDAYRQMKSIAKRTKWNDALEYMQGYLLGYSDEQNDLWFAHRQAIGNRWGLQVMYAAVDHFDIDRMHKVGRKVLFNSRDEDIHLYLPHYGSSRLASEGALKVALSHALARFYAPLRDILEYAEGTTELADIKFEVYNLPKSELATFNESIDGKIEII